MTLAISPETTVGQLVTERPSRAKVFEKFAIDYCCGGKLPLAALCAKKGIDPAVVLAALEAADASPEEVHTDWSQAPLDVLATHILEVHHAFLHEELPRVSMLSQKVARVHGGHHPELIEIAEIYHRFAEQMLMHMAKEERVLFPAIIRLAQGDGSFPVNGPISVMEAEHDDAGRDLEALRELTNNYTVPEDACNSYRALFAGLAEIEADTHLHVHKENNILFPRAIAKLQSLS
jgi:regulator of cell morphogenesis and NO signaling